ncbi:MAG: Gfo/Idh/MocA family oxidoreductase [Pseudomonadota bacterium]
MEDRVGLAVAGYGLVGRRHVDAIGATDWAVVAAVIEPDAAARQDASDAGFAVFETLEAFLRDGAAEGVILATPSPMHVDQGLACVAKGLPVLVEKPIATRADDAMAFVAAADAAGVPLLVGHHRRHNPLIQRAKALIDEGRIGTIRAVQSTCWLYKPDAYFDAAPWRKDAGAGPVSVNLVHDVDVLRYLCGEVVSVRAVARPSARGYANEDVASAVLEFESGAVGTITVSDSIVAPFSWEMTSREHPIYPPVDATCCVIGGSHGSLSIPDLKLWTYKDGARDWWTPLSAEIVDHVAADPLVNQIENFVSVIRGAGQALVSGREGARTLRVIEAIQKAADSGAVLCLVP